MRKIYTALCSVALMAIAIFALSPGTGWGDTPRCGWYGQPPRAATDHELRTSVLCLVNQIRERNRIRPLAFNDDLRQSASAHSASMVRSRSFSHYAGGSTVTSRVARSGYLASASSFRVAENIGAGEGRRYGSPIAIVRTWMGSPPHRYNILDSGLRDFGVGVARGDPLGAGSNAATYTLIFATRSH